MSLILEFYKIYKSQNFRVNIEETSSPSSNIYSEVKTTQLRVRQLSILSVHAKQTSLLITSIIFTALDNVWKLAQDYTTSHTE